MHFHLLSGARCQNRCLKLALNNAGVRELLGWERPPSDNIGHVPHPEDDFVGHPDEGALQFKYLWRKLEPRAPHLRAQLGRGQRFRLTRVINAEPVT